MPPRKVRLQNSHGPIDKAARKRRRKGGKLAVGRDSGTLESLREERAYVFDRDHYGCVLCRIWCSRCQQAHDPVDGGCHIPATDFAHVRSRAQGGDDSRFNAIATCHDCNMKMSLRPFKTGAPIVTAVTVKGVRGFDIEWVRCAGKLAYRLGADVEILGAGFVAAERS